MTAAAASPTSPQPKPDPAVPASNSGIAYLVGAGPGDPGLVTLRARELIARADVLIYDYLCNPVLLGWARADCEKIYAGKKSRDHTLTQEQINEHLVQQVRAGRCVVRLKGGDPYLFGRGGEEAQALVAQGLTVEVVPGVTSAIAAPAYAGIPVTHRDHASCVTFITGHEDPTKEASALDWRGLAHFPGTKVFPMGVERLPQITAALIAACADPTTPAALVRWGTTGQQASLEGTLGTIAEIAAARQFKAPAVFIVGSVVSLRRELNWFESRPLFGQRVVVTRTRTGSSALGEKLRALGADVLEIPTLRIEASPLPAATREQMRTFAAHFDWLVFTSPNGVEHFFAQFFAEQPEVRALGAVQIATVGPATTKKLAEYHLTAARTPSTFTAEALAATFTPEEVRGRRFCLARGHLAEPTLAQHLAQHGGIVSEWTVYATLPETDDVTGARARYLNEGAHWITFASGSAVENWCALQLPRHAAGITSRHASMGPVTSAALRNAGLSVDLESPASTIAAFAAAIAALGASSIKDARG